MIHNYDAKTIAMVMLDLTNSTNEEFHRLGDGDLLSTTWELQRSMFNLHHHGLHWPISITAQYWKHGLQKQTGQYSAKKLASCEVMWWKCWNVFNGKALFLKFVKSRFQLSLLGHTVSYSSYYWDGYIMSYIIYLRGAYQQQHPLMQI